MRTVKEFYVGPVMMRTVLFIPFYYLCSEAAIKNVPPSRYGRVMILNTVPKYFELK